MGSPLVNFCVDLYEKFAKDRAALLEPKWNLYRAAFARDTSSFDSYAGTWRTYQGKQRPITEEEFISDNDSNFGDKADWHSDTFMPIAKQKSVALTNLVNDQVFKGQKIPFQCSVYPGLYASEAQFKDLDKRRQVIQDDLDEMLVRTKAVDAFKTCTLSGSIYGEGYLRKVMIPIETRNMSEDGRIIVGARDYLGADSVSVWDIFRDLQFDNLDDGAGIIQRSLVSFADVKTWVDEGGTENYWIPDSVEKAVTNYNSEKSANSESYSPRLRELDDLLSNREYIECWVRVPTKLMDLKEDDDYDVSNESDYSYVLAGILGDELIRFQVVEKGDHPFYRFEVEEDPDSVGGIGVIENVIGEQKVLNGMIRNFEDNKKLASNLIFASDEGSFTGDFKNWEPGTDLKLTGAKKDIREAIQQFVVADTGDSLLSAIQMFMQFADMSSNLPREQQGQASVNPQTAYEVQQRLERSGKYVGQVIDRMDEVIDAYIDDCYMLLAQDEEFEGLGMAFKVNANGFSSYEARAIRQQGLMMLFTILTQNPEMMKYVEPQFFLEEISKPLGIPPSQFIKSDEKLEKEAEEAQQDPVYQAELKKVDAEAAKLDAEVQKLLAEAKALDAKVPETEEKIKTSKSERVESFDPVAELQR